MQKLHQVALEPLEPRLLMSGTGCGPDDASGIWSDPTTLSIFDTAKLDLVNGDTNPCVLGIDPIWFEDLMPGWQSLTTDAIPLIAGFPAGENRFGLGVQVSQFLDRWIVQLNEEGIVQAGSVNVVGDLLGLDLLGGEIVRGLGLAGMVLITTASDADADQIFTALVDHDLVEYIEPDLVFDMQALPDDPLLSNLWSMHNLGQSGGTVGADINAALAWELGTGSSDVVVGVIDTGVDYNHPDLLVNMWINPGEIAGNGLDDDGNGFVDDVHGYDFYNNDGDPMGDHSHGTHVAGTIEAVGDNGVSVAGVSWSTSIMALKFLGGNGSGSSSDAVRAVNYATMMRNSYGVNVRLTNNSWGGSRSYAPLETAIRRSFQADMLFVAAAGNSGVNTDHQPHYPSTYTTANVISVAATDRNDQLASFSNYGLRSVDIAAPGVSIYSTVPNGGHA